MSFSLFMQQRDLACTPRAAAELRDQGMTRSITAGHAWRRATYGYHLPRATPQTTAQRILDAAARLPQGGAIAGWAAAFVCGVDWLDGQTEYGQLRPVTLCVGQHVHRRPTSEVRYVRDRLEAADVTIAHDLAVTAPFRTAFDTARWAPSVAESVVALDALAHFGLVGYVGLAGYLHARPGWRGVPQLRAALGLVDPGVLSPWESRLRMLYQLQAGLPRPRVNPQIFDDRGRFVAMPDLLDAEAGLALEYDGAGHRDRLQHNRDNAREEALEALGLIVVRADSHDLRHRRARLLERVLSARRRGLLRNRSHDHWTVTSPGPSWGR